MIGLGDQAAGQGFEPQLPVPETGVLPLDDPATGRRDCSRAPARPSDLEPVDLHESIDETLRLLRRDERCSAAIDIRCDFAPPGPTVRADPNQLRQVFWNVFLNAVQAMKGAGTLSVATRQADGAVQIAVDDTGPGVPREDVVRLFEPFQTRRPGGIGLGLATVRRIVEDHGGRVSLSSEPGAGTRVLIALPHAG